MKTFITSQFNYCPLVWMFHNRSLNHKINRLHERALRIVYQNENLTFQELLDKDNSVTTHHKNLQKLATEMYKIKNHLSPLPMQELFTEKVNNYDLRNKRSWVTCNVRTVKYGTETIMHVGPKTWELIPAEIKESKSLPEFKERIKRWKPSGCTCRFRGRQNFVLLASATLSACKLCHREKSYCVWAIKVVSQILIQTDK